MSESDLADRFTRDVDNLLLDGGGMDVEPAPPGYRADLQVARALAAADFSFESRVRLPLRRRLLARLETTRTVRHPFPALRPWLSWRAATVVVVLAVAVVLTLTPAGQALAARAGNVIREMLWPNLSVQQVAPGSTPEDVEARRARYEGELAAGRAWELEFEGYAFGGCCVDGMRDEVVSLPAAVTEAGYPLRLPAYLPGGLRLAQVRLLGVAPYDVFVSYEGPAGRLGLYQSFVGYRSEQRVGKAVVVVTARESAVVSESVVDQVRVGDLVAARIGHEALVWEQDGVSITLIGPGMGLETLVRIGESLAAAR